jgi:hypothetical protein
MTFRFPLRLAAIALASALLVPTTALGAEPVRSLFNIPPAERMQLAPSTLVHLRDGRTTTMATVLAEHQARMAQVRMTRPLLKMTRRAPINAAAIAATAATPVMLFPIHGDFSSGPLDYQKACQAGTPAGCVYLPSGVPLTVDTQSKSAISVDYLIDQSTCAELKAQWTDNSCTFKYPLGTQVNFFPGVPPTAEVSQHCSSKHFYKIIDPRGAIQITYLPPGYHTPGEKTITLDAPAICQIKVYAPKPD